VTVEFLWHFSSYAQDKVVIKDFCLLAFGIGGIMDKADIEKLNKTMDSMAEYEMLLSDLYHKCAEAWPKDREFWLDIAGQEDHHAENIRKMQEIINQKLSHFEADRPLNPIAINTAIAYIKDIIKRLTAGQYSYERILNITLDIEKSVLETHYSEIVKTDDVEYQTLMKSILEETHAHKSKIQQKLTGLKSKA
jgi:hypothetical protein